MSPAVVVIGADVNELVAAHLLARAGHRVLVLAGPTALEDGRQDHAGWIPPRVVSELQLEGRGLEVRYPDPWITAPLPGGGRLELWRDMARSVEAIRRLSPKDAGKWLDFCERMERLARMLETVYTSRPPDLVSREFGDLAQLAGLGLRIRKLGRQGIEDLLRLIPMSVADLLDDTFECDALKGVLGAAGVRNLHQGPRSGGTAFRLLHHHIGNAPGVFRQPYTNVWRVLRELPNIELRSGAKVEAISVRDGRAAGVVLVDGEEIAAALVVSGADPKRTLAKLVDPGWLDPQFTRAVRNIRCRGVVAHITLALDRAPGFSTLAVAPSLDYLERAHDDAKYGNISQTPWLEAHSVGQAANGRHRLEVHLQYAPYALANGDWDDGRRIALGGLAIEVLSRHVPEFGAVSVENVLTPRDLEERYDWPEGQAEHAEPALDQLLWMRPTPELARYRTPIAGLYLCGPGTHSGGGIAGACGYNAAREILRDLRRGDG